MTVWAVHEVRDDISPARQFGTVRYINHRYINGDELEQGYRTTGTFQDEVGSGHTYARDWVLPSAFERNLRDAALSFNPSEDYLLIAGDHLQLLAFTTILSSWYPAFSVLRYDRRMNEYIPVLLRSGLREALPRASFAAEIGNASNHIGTENGQDRAKDLREIERLRTCLEELEAYRDKWYNSKRTS